ncbi:MAG: ABC transporter substrate-binding protein, partial [bacterium]
GDVWKKSIELGRGEIEAKYGQKIEIIYEDSQMKPTDAATAASKLINTNKVKAIIIGTSRETLAAAPVAEQSRVLMLAGGSSAEITKAGDYIFRVYPSDFYQGNNLADLAIKKGYKKMAVLAVADDYGQGIGDVFAKKFRELGGQVVITETLMPEGVSDFRTQLTKISITKPQAVLLALYDRQSLLVLKQMKELDLSWPLLSTETIKNPDTIKGNEVLFEGILFASYVEPKTIEYEGFLADYKAKYGVEAGPYAPGFFDNAQLILTALIESKGDVEKAKAWLYAVKDWHGATGTINFDANGDVIGKSYTIYTVKNGQFVPYEKSD